MTDSAVNADDLGVTLHVDLADPPAAGGHEPPAGGHAARAANLVGDRLRDIRRQQGLSLAEVEERSGGDWKAVVVGAYERGDRAVTVPRLAELARFYGVPLSSLLPARPRPPSAPDQHGRDTEGHGRRTGHGGRVRLDLHGLGDDGEVLDPIALRAVARFAEHIQLQRGDHNGRVLTIRTDDLRTIAVAIGHDPEALVTALREHGAIVADAENDGASEGGRTAGHAEGPSGAGGRHAR